MVLQHFVAKKPHMCLGCRMVARASVNQLEATTPFDNFSFEPIKEHQVLLCATAPISVSLSFLSAGPFCGPLGLFTCRV